jgi:biopolymer transport protein ExbB/TolQ
MQFTFVELWASMGFAARFIAITMLAMSLVSVIVGCERLLALYKGHQASRAFAEKLANKLHDGNVDSALTFISDNQQTDMGPLGRVLTSGLSAYQGAPKHDEDFTFEAVARVLERQALREAHTMKRGVGVLATIASTAPFVGLLGTVLGIVNSFQMMASSGSGGLAAVSSGIAEALTTTALGLLVALPAMAAYNGLTAMVEARALDISEASNELLDVLALHLRTRNTATTHENPSPRSRRPVAVFSEK